MLYVYSISVIFKLCDWKAKENSEDFSVNVKLIFSLSAK